MQGIAGFFSETPLFVIILIVSFAIGIVFAVLRKLIKFAITLAALIILIIVIVKLLQH